MRKLQQKVKILSGLQMSNNLRTLLSQQQQTEMATKHGRTIHAILQNMDINNISQKAESDLLQKISSNQILLNFFTKPFMTEVPIAGYINNKFISRRIDRLKINETEKTIDILDYKTDTDKQARHDDYVLQISEYKKLLQDAFPGYQIKGYILWLVDFSLEQI